MSYQFWGRFGVVKPEAHVTEKFLLFFVVGGKEIPLYQMQSSGLVKRVEDGDRGPDDVTALFPSGRSKAHPPAQLFTTSNNVLKVFIGQQGFGVPRRFYSFYFRLLNEAAPVVSIRPFSGERTGLLFKAKLRFLSVKQVMGMLASDCESRRFIANQTLPVEVIRQMLEVDKSEMRKGIRHLRVGKK